jgi:hypothetical protein
LEAEGEVAENGKGDFADILNPFCLEEFVCG